MNQRVTDTAEAGLGYFKTAATTGLFFCGFDVLLTHLITFIFMQMY